MSSFEDELTSREIELVDDLFVEIEIIEPTIPEDIVEIIVSDSCPFRRPTREYAMVLIPRAAVRPDKRSTMTNIDEEL